MSLPPAIEIENLTVRFDGKTVISRFSLRLESGSKIALTGSSGSGKTTLLRCILGFVVPDEGTIRINGERLTSASVWTLRSILAYVAQEPDLGSGTVGQILERPFTYRVNMGKRDNLSRIPNLLERLLLPSSLLDKEIEKLSGGEKQRVAIISADLLDRSIFLLDEASSALDNPAREAVADFFRHRRDLSMLSVSHDPEGFSFCDRIIKLRSEADGGK